jgi:hypothetical protein
MFVFQLLQGNQGRNMADQSISISVSEPRKARRGLFSPIVYTINSKIRQETRNRFEPNLRQLIFIETIFQGSICIC